MDKKDDNAYDIYINDATMNINEDQNSNNNNDNYYQDYENIIKNKDESLAENSDNCYNDYPPEDNNYRRK